MKSKLQKEMRTVFLADFKDLERALARGVEFPFERLVVELRLTRASIAALRREGGPVFSRFETVYEAMRRHGLLAQGISWGAWLRLYRRKKKTRRHDPNPG